MKPSAFDYIRADTLTEALSVLAEEQQDTKVLAGGQSLLPMLNMRLARPTVVLDINHIAELDTLSLEHAKDANENGEVLKIGALVRQRQIERYAGQTRGLRMLHAALLNIGHPQTRNRGTVGGSLVHADAAAELPLTFVTLGGHVILQSTRGERTVDAEEFFLSHFTTAIEDDELLTASVWHLPVAHEGVAFKEFRRRHGDFALMAAACVIALDEQQRIQKVRLGLGGISEKPVLLDEAQALIGERWSREGGEAIATSVVEHLALEGDTQASAAYRQQLARVLIARIIEAAHNDALSKEAAHV